MSDRLSRLAFRPESMIVALVALSALDVGGRLATFGGATVTAYQVGLVAVVGVFAWMVVAGRARVRATPADGWLALLAIAAAVTVPFAASSRTALVQLASLYSSIVLALLVAWIASDGGRLRRVLEGLILLSAVLALLAVAERLGLYSLQGAGPLLGTTVRARVSFKDPNMLGGVLAAAAVTALPLAVFSRGWRSAVLWSSMGLALAGVLSTQSRGALVGMVVGALVVIGVAPMRTRTRVAVIVGGAVALLVSGLVLGGDWVALRFTNILSDQSAVDRLRLARSGFRMFLDHPFGIGPGNWPLMLPAYRDPAIAGGLVESHTTLVTVLAEDGLFGFFGLVGALVASTVAAGRAAVLATDREVRVLAAASLGALSVLLVQSLTYSLETDKFLWFAVGCCLAAAALAGRSRPVPGAGLHKLCIVQYNSSRFLTRVDRAARSLSAAGLEVVLVAVKDDETPAFEQRDGYVVRRVELKSRRLPRWTRPLRFVEAVARTFAAAYRERADVYDARDIYPLLVTWAAASLRRAVFVYDSDELNLYRNWPWAQRRWWRVLAGLYEGFFIRRADAVITTDAGRAAILAKRYRIPPPVVVRNVPESLSTITPDTAFREHALKGRRHLLLYAGGLVPNRGLVELVDAMEELPGFALAFVGPGQLAGELRDRIKSRGLADRAEVYPPVPYAELMRITAAADAAVIPIVGSCLSYVHAAPNKLFESMMAGVPVVASDLPDMAEVVRSERAGTLISDPTDPASIAAAIRALFDADEDPRAVGARAREAALARHNWELEEHLLLDVYRELGLLSATKAVS